MTLPLPKASILISLWLDFNCNTDSYTRNDKKDLFLESTWVRYYVDPYLGNHNKDYQYASPLKGDLKGLPPPMLLHISDVETFFDNCVLFREKADRQGVQMKMTVWNNLIHVFQAFGFIPEGKEVLKEICGFVSDHFEKKEEPQSKVLV